MVCTTAIILAASSVLPLAFAAPIARKAPRSLVERAGYTVFGGSGEPSDGWPSVSSWKSFDQLWSDNVATIQASCAQFGVADNSDDETAAVKQALQDTATDSLPAAFLLAVMMQESKGCVRAPTTSYGETNPGLFQSFNGQGSCNNGGTVTNPCPSSTITKMVQEGAGNGLSFGLSQAITQSGATDDSKYYKGARIYNSGSVTSNNLGLGVATHCYASDIANRLVGWASGTSSCSESSIGSLTGTATSTSDTSSSGTTTGSTGTTTTVAAAPATSSTTSTTTTTTTTERPSNAYPDASQSCTSWYTVNSGDSCQSTNTDFATLQKLNSGLDANCSNLWANYAYCTAA